MIANEVGDHHSGLYARHLRDLSDAGLGCGQLQSDELGDGRPIGCLGLTGLSSDRGPRLSVPTFSAKPVGGVERHRRADDRVVQVRPFSWPVIYGMPRQAPWRTSAKEAHQDAAEHAERIRRLAERT